MFGTISNNKMSQVRAQKLGRKNELFLLVGHEFLQLATGWNDDDSTSFKFSYCAFVCSCTVM